MRNLLLFIVLATIGVSCKPDNFTKTFTGIISSPVVVRLTNINGTLTGSYFYFNKGKEIQLRGKIGYGGKAELDEISSGAITGHFKGTIADGAFSGEWISPDGSRSYKFLLVESEEDYQAALNVASAPKSLQPSGVITNQNIQPSDLRGNWSVVLECVESGCSYSKVSERYAEDWEIEVSDNEIAAVVSGSEHRVKRYAMQVVGPSAFRVKSISIGILSKYSSSSGTLSMTDDYTANGVIRLNSSTCYSIWNVTMNKKVQVKF